MKLYNQLEILLSTADRQAKFEGFYRLYETFKAGQSVQEDTHVPIVFDAPSYGAFCTLCDHHSIPRPKKLHRLEDQARLLHAVAHIEYSAIDLALDAAYRFRNLPHEFYADWLAVADEEIAHFLMLEKLLAKLGVTYGDLPVHTGLFDASMRTLTLIDRMAIIPRHMEAGGLDANEQMRAKVKTVADRAPVMAEFLEALDVILRDEIDHVRKGDRWFRYACKAEGRHPDCFGQIVKAVLGQTPLRRELNVSARLAAGFSCDELAAIAGRQVCE